MTDNGERGSGSGVEKSTVVTGIDRDVLAALKTINDRLDRLERTVGALTGTTADPADALNDVAEPPAGAPGRREPTLGRLPSDDNTPTVDTGADERLSEDVTEAFSASGREPSAPPQGRSGARGVLTFLVAIGLLAGGVYWLSQNLDWRDSLPSEWFGDGSRAASQPETAENALAPASGGGEGGGADRPLAETEALSTPSRSDDAGAAMPAAPRPAVEIVALEEGFAPLPDDAPAELRQLARQSQAGDPQAQHDLAFLYAIGDRIPRNFERAAFWFRRAADAGVTSATYNLAVLTQRGDGVAQDSDSAFRLFMQAAEDGHPQAQFAVGLAYDRGRGVEPDPREAASWFQAASANGFPRGAYYLGRLFERGFEGNPDLAAAAGWYRIAAEAGEPDAEAALARLSDADTATVTARTPATAAPIPEQAPEPVAPGGAPSATAEVSREQISEIQQRLEALGYAPGPVDGLMGQRTEEAITAFQQDGGIAADGEASLELLDRLRDADAAQSPSPP